MGKKYLLFETPQGNFKMYLPRTINSSVTFRSITGRDYTTWLNTVIESTAVDFSQGEYLPYNAPYRSDIQPYVDNFDTVEFPVIAAGDVWKLGSLTGTWVLASTYDGNDYYCYLKDNDNETVLTLRRHYRSSPETNPRLDCYAIYDESDDKLISLQGLGANFISVHNYNPEYSFYTAGGTSTYSINTTNSTRLNAAVEAQEEPDPPTDPYDPSGDGSGYSGSGGGPAPTGGTGTTGNGGLHDDSSDAIPTPSLPTDAIISSGLFTAYNPSTSQLASFASALWNMQVSDINDVLRFLFGGDAFNAVIGLHLLPVSPATSSSQNIKLGNWDTGVSAPKISSQYKQIQFGSLLLPEYWGNCIDYAPYTKIQLALPYIGIVDVDTDDVLGSTNTLTYNIDVLSGAICATLHCVKFNLSSVIYQWSGACAVSLPFSGASYNSVLSAIAGVAAAGMGFASIAAGPIGAALPAAALAAGGGAFGAGSAASIMGTMKGKVQKSGAFGANSGALGIMTPYFILTRPVQSVPETWQADKGYPSNISAQLGTLTGYTEVSEINLECSGTEAEKKEIIDLLKKGVLF